MTLGAKTVFKDNGEFPPISSPTAHNHLKEEAFAKAKHNPIPVPSHFKEPVRQALWEDEKRGIITPVLPGMATDWCSTMVITDKKNGKPQRTIDYQHLNSQCKWETHHTGSPFHCKCHLSKRKVLDTVPLDKESQLLTTFITQWRGFMYHRILQGHLASGDTYT